VVNIMPLDNNVDTHYTGGWVDPVTALDVSEKRQHRESNPLSTIVNPAT
jgi:hypothetical protein